MVAKAVRPSVDGFFYIMLCWSSTLFFHGSGATIQASVWQ